MAKVKIHIEVEGVGHSDREWEVEDALARPYAMAYDFWVSLGGLELSQSLYELVLDNPDMAVEAGAAIALAKRARSA